MEIDSVAADKSASVVGGANAIAACNIAAGGAGKRTYISTLAMGFTGANPATGIAATLSDGTTTYNFAVNSQGIAMCFENPLAFAANAQVTATLQAGGAGAVGVISMSGYQKGS